METKARRWVAGAAALVVVAAGVGYLQFVAVGGGPAPVAAGGLPAGTGVTVVDLSGGGHRLVRLPGDGSVPQVAGGDGCLRHHAASGTAVCLRVSGPGPTYSAEITRDGAAVRTVLLPGVPSRAKVSPSGSTVTWTSFVTGDSYQVPGGFSTRTGFLDLVSGRLVESLEGFAVRVDGAPLVAADVNFWGMTMEADDRDFYVTVASGGRTWLARGDVDTATADSVRPGAECPSLSPDGTRVAYKKRIGRFGPWELAVLDLAGGVETVLPGTSGVDDQAEWLDGDTLAFALVPRGTTVPAVYTAPADGSRPATELVPAATSPSAGG